MFFYVAYQPHGCVKNLSVSPTPRSPGFGVFALGHFFSDMGELCTGKAPRSMGQDSQLGLGKTTYR
jgi:hypothetical protein